MAQVEAMKRYLKSSSGGTSEQTMEQLFHSEDSAWAAHTSPTFGRNHDLEEHDHHTKKSVLTKVKEKAKKLKHTLSNKMKHGHDGNSPPAWGVSLEDDDYDDEDEDPGPEYYGAPMYESAKAPQDLIKTARQHPQEDHVISEKHDWQSNFSPRKEEVHEESPIQKISRSLALEPAPIETMNDSNTISDSLVGKLAQSETPTKSKQFPKSVRGKVPPHQDTQHTSKTIGETVTEKLAPAYNMASEATDIITSKIHDMAIATSAALSPSESSKDETSINEKNYDKGVSVKEYLRLKLEPGEDEKALSQVISDAISPRRKVISEALSPKLEASKGVVEKVRGAMSSYLAMSESSSPSMRRNTSSNIPLSTNAYEVVEEENKERILQAN
ncbi:low-temperature-induced protein [Thalictrum thalictroides]|uniref:Low-temperature-induced protein n=1 Tax=Thalictrum thalictroides TaxID=46969 RepID=A0A7J6UUJ1_THATH|nr:low-temperature-induced protein [Thalictrum thalictroides]